MKNDNKILKILAAGAVLATMHLSAHAVDSVSAEYAFGSNVQVVRLGAQWDWSQRWFASNGNHIGGYWDLSLGQWRGDKYRNIDGEHQNITSIGITPVFRWQKDSKKGFYAEAGVGAHLMSETYNNADNRIATAFTFGDHVGIGYVFNNKLDLGLKYQHFSNGGIKKPNSGVNMTVLHASYHF
ncbi:MAG: acyloxyacyl hydrolase [Burkholderiaceae bacterium]|nr:acyloxyacyl hydrolase [Burkholderiaceae bacterium]